MKLTGGQQCHSDRLQESALCVLERLLKEERVVPGACRDALGTRTMQDGEADQRFPPITVSGFQEERGVLGDGIVYFETSSLEKFEDIGFVYAVCEGETSDLFNSLSLSGST